MNACRTIFSVYCGLVAAACTSLPSRPILRGRVNEYGLFEVFGRERVPSGAPTPDGTVTLSSDNRFTQHTDQVPARIGVKFGFTYTLQGITKRTVALQKVVKHPAFRNTRGKIERTYSVTYQSSREDAASSLWGYELGRSEELVPGVWVFELWYKGRKLLSQSFTVYIVDQNRSQTQRAQPNQTMEPTASRRTIQLCMSSTPQPAATRAFARRG
jgi:hypothetical protein